MLLSATLARDAFTAGRVLVIVCLAVTIAIGAGPTGQWMTGGVKTATVTRQRVTPEPALTGNDR